jgi:hypothetical protein
MKLFRWNTHIKLRWELRIGYIHSTNLCRCGKSNCIKIINNDILSKKTIWIFTVYINYTDLSNSFLNPISIQITKKL